MPMLAQVKQFVWKYLDILAIWILAVLLFTGDIFDLNLSLYSFLLVIFLLTIPGYLLTLSLFENRKILASFEWILFSIVFSLAVITLGAVSLLFLHISLNRNSLLVVMLASMALFSAIVFFIRKDALRPWNLWIDKIRAAKFSIKPFLIMVLVLIGFSGLLTAILTNHNGERFTEFAALGINQDDSTTTTITKNLKALKITVINHEQGPKSYYMIVNGGSFKEEIPIGNIEDGGEWLFQLPFSSRYQTVEKLTLELYRSDQTRPYRQLIFWFTNQ